MNPEEKKKLEGTKCQTCPGCMGPCPTQAKKAKEVVCMDGVARGVVKTGRRCVVVADISASLSSSA